MPRTCGAFTERYVGRGKERTRYAGNCVYDAGHEGPCCPPQLVNTDSIAILKEEIREAKELAGQVLQPGGESYYAAVERLKEIIDGWPDPDAFPHG